MAWQEVVFQQDTVLERLMSLFDLTLGLRMERRAEHMAHLVGFAFGVIRRSRCNRQLC